MIYIFLTGAGGQRPPKIKSKNKIRAGGIFLKDFLPFFLYYNPMNSWKENVSFILVEPKEPGNIGASARAMKNMGFKRLELVNPGDFPSDEASRLAVNSLDVLKRAPVHKDLKSAIMEKSVIAGTTRRAGKTRGLILSVKEGARRIAKAAVKNKVAVLFGREDRGLLNSEVSECGFLIKIPTDSASPSLNLAQAVLLTAYEMHLAGYKRGGPELVSKQELDLFLKKAHSTLKLLRYIPEGGRDIEKTIMVNIRRLALRSGLAEWELRMLYGILSRIEKELFLRKGQTPR
jgi:TrmH family RNA methyltransferase